MVASTAEVLRLLGILAAARTETARAQATHDFNSYIMLCSRELPSDDFAKVLNDLANPIRRLVDQSASQEKLAGVVAIGTLVDVLEADQTRAREMAYRAAGWTQRAMLSNDNQVLSLAAKTFARLIAIGGIAMSNVADIQIKFAMECLTGEQRAEDRRYSAVLILRELARAVPQMLYDHVQKLLDHLWIALRDPKVATREAAADALSGCLDSVSKRDPTTKLEAYSLVYDQAQKGFKIGSADAIHGSLLGYKELFIRGQMFMRDNYNQTCEQILSYKDHRESLIRKTVIELIPTMVSYNQTEFTHKHMHKAMNYLLGQLKKDRDRTTCFHAIGHVALVTTNNMVTYLDNILVSIKDALNTRGKKNAMSEDPIFQCISMLASAVGQALTKHMHELLDLMFAYGLTRSLRHALNDLVHYIPPLLPTIQERLLNLIAMILSGESYRPPGAPTLARVKGVPREGSSSQALLEHRDKETIALALDTLSAFQFTGYVLNEFVRDHVVGYTEDDSPEVRKAAALTSCKIFARDDIIFQTSSQAIQLVGEVMEKLLAVAVADPDSTVRLETLQNLDPKFDRHLAQAENVRLLFIALNDELFEIRQHAVAIIGRLAIHNPAYVMPALRKTFLQLLTEVEYSDSNRIKEDSARLLGSLVSASSRLTKPYVKAILNVLLPRATDPSPAVAASVMSAMGALAVVGGEDVIPYIKQYMSLIIDTLHDQSSPQKRLAALSTLGSLCGNTAYVIEPYLEYPSLLGTLTGLLKTEPHPPIRAEVVRVMGILGALDPYSHAVADTRTKDVNSSKPSIADPAHPANISPSHDEYYPTVAFGALLAIFRDPSLREHHTAVVQAITYIFDSLRLKCVMHLPQVVPAFLDALRSVAPAVHVHEFYFEKFGRLISTMKQHVRNHVPPILALIKDFWISIPSLQSLLVGLLVSLAQALEGEFKIYFPSVLPLMLQSFEAGWDRSRVEGRKVLQTRILQAFDVFGANLEEYLHLVIPVIAQTFENTNAPVEVRQAAIETVTRLSRKINFADHASRIILPLTRVLASSSEMRAPVMDALHALLTYLGPDYVPFIPTVNRVLAQQQIQHAHYTSAVAKLLNGEELDPAPDPGDPSPFTSDNAAPAPDAGVGKLHINQQTLKSAWELVENPKAEDWRNWARRLNVQLLKSSSSHSLRACANLAQEYNNLARDLFNAAFVSCWAELLKHYQDELVHAIEQAMSSPTVPPDVTQLLLNLAEFMEHDEKPLPITPQVLGLHATRCHAYAKALHYKEIESLSEPTADVIEDLIRINNQLQQPDVSVGILRYAQKAYDIELKEDWYEKLDRWDDALAAYARRQEDQPGSSEIALGRMRCLHALGEWEHLAEVANEYWDRSSSDVRRKIAPLAAAAAWGLGQWDMMEDYINVLKKDQSERAWFRAILFIHRNLFTRAQREILKARELLDPEVTTIVGESYNRAYSQIVRIQMLAELEEVIAYKEASENPARRQMIQRSWLKRLKGCQADVEVWQRILKVRNLVMAPKDSMEMWIKFANLCRKSNRFGLAEKVINSLTGEVATDTPIIHGPPHVIYANLKLMWAKGTREDALTYLRDFASRLAQDLGLEGTPGDAQQMISLELSASGKLVDFTRLLARCYYKLGEWQTALQESWDSEAVPDILQSYLLATNLDRNWYKAWHAWALANSEVVSQFTRTQTEGETTPLQIFRDHLVPAVQGFFKSIALSPGDALQDTLRLLTLWFRWGHQEDVSAAVSDNIGSVSVDTWLEVMPQLIARIQAPSNRIRTLIHVILTDVGKAHPQALVYPLTVASKYPSPGRRRAALSILERMRTHSSALVEQALLVSQELIRVAILWHELWFAGLEEASRLYYGEHDTNGMFETLEPLHDMLEKGPETLREIAFYQTNGRELYDARQACKRYVDHGDIRDLNSAWELYYGVFRRIKQSPMNPAIIELQAVSPRLLGVKDFDLAVPGTYHSGVDIIRILNFTPAFDVLNSKQQPRKLKIKGSDGHDYTFLLKGHEDMRQDERVMQLFGLCNTLLEKDPETFKRHLLIQKYPVVPLSPKSGLLGWVDNTDTLHVLVKNYRENRKILLNIEHRLMLQMSPHYDLLCLMQKIEVFEYALENTAGQDLYRILWLKSRSSEVWLERRTEYTRSLATMSMVGHILGLGDRHPSNLLLDRVSGKIVHVDMGDCFEVAMHRDKYPEKVPFRLTRMMTNAMEISGVDGTFRTTSENVMRVLRDNNESIIAVLEAFVHDPLINWRLVAPRQEQTGRGGRYAQDETHLFDSDAADAVNQSAVQVIQRVQQKLAGRDFNPNVSLNVPEQVHRLILQATAKKNLAIAFIGWCAFW